MGLWEDAEVARLLGRALVWGTRGSLEVWVPPWPNYYYLGFFINGKQHLICGPPLPERACLDIVVSLRTVR